MNKFTFVIPCYNVSANKGYIKNCVSSIKNSNPNAKILVVDSDSPDRSYMDQLGDVEILDVHNKNYDFGAYWIGYRHVQSEYYVFTHDSTIWNYEVKEEDFNKRPITPFYWFTGGHSSEALIARDWALNQASSNCGYTQKLPEQFIAYGIMVVKKEFLDLLASQNFDKCLPSRKMEAVYVGEFLWALAMRNNNIDVPSACYYGPLQGGVDLDHNKIFNKYSGCIEQGRI